MCAFYFLNCSRELAGWIRATGWPLACRIGDLNLCLWLACVWGAPSQRSECERRIERKMLRCARCSSARVRVCECVRVRARGAASEDSLGGSCSYSSVERRALSLEPRASRPAPACASARRRSSSAAPSQSPRSQPLARCSSPLDLSPTSQQSRSFATFQPT